MNRGGELILGSRAQSSIASRGCIGTVNWCGLGQTHTDFGITHPDQTRLQVEKY
jgi:hypothetical protein